MAIAFGASFTANSSKTSSTTIAVTTGVAVPAGSLVVVFAGCDNLSATTPTASFTDSVGGNTWTVLSTATSNSATAAAGQVVHLAVSKLTNALLSTSTITCTLSSAVTVRTIEGAYFTGADAIQRGTAGNASGTTTTWSASVTGGLTGDLVLGAITTQNNSAITGDTDTTNGTWGSLGAINTTGGGGAANIALLGQYKILTANGTQTWNGSGLNTAGSSYTYAILRPTPATVTRTATGSGLGTQTGVDIVVAIRTATGSGTGTETASGRNATFNRTATDSGTGTQTASGRNATFNRTATGSGLGTQTASGSKLFERTATGSGLGTESATALAIPARTATGSGVGTQTAVGLAPVKRTATGSGVGTQTAVGLGPVKRTATGSGTGTQTATGVSSVVLKTIVHRAGNDSFDGNWTNSAGNNTNLYTYVDEVYASPDGGFIRGATDTTDTALTTDLRLQLSSTTSSSVPQGRHRSARIRFRWRAANLVDDTVKLEYALVGSTNTVVAGAAAGTYMSTTIASNTFVDSGWIDFNYVDTSVGLITPYVRFRQVITANGSPDGTWIEIDAFELEVTYTWYLSTAARTENAVSGNILFDGDANKVINSSLSVLGSTYSQASHGFTATSTGNVSGVLSLWSKDASATGTITAELWSADASFIPATLLATANTVDIASLSNALPYNGGVGPTHFTFNHPHPTLTSGQRYAFVYKVTSLSGTVRIWNSLSSASLLYYKLKQVSDGAWVTYSADPKFTVLKPEAIGSVTPSRTATGSGTGTQTATGSIVTAFLRSATGSGTGTESASYLVTPAVRRTATGSGVGTMDSTGLVTRFRTATGSGTGTESATGFKTVFRTAVGSGAGTSTADTLHNNIRSASGAGGASPSAIAIGFVTAIRTALGSGLGTSDSFGLHIHLETGTGSGLGSSTAVSELYRTREATGSGLGSGFTVTTVIKLRSATGSGLGAAQVYWAITQSGMKFSYWGSNLMLT